MWGNQSPEFDIQWLKLRGKVIDTGIVFLALQPDVPGASEQIFQWNFPELHVKYSVTHGFYFNPVGVSFEDSTTCTEFLMGSREIIT